jgi:hypothetical protein
MKATEIKQLIKRNRLIERKLMDTARKDLRRVRKAGVISPRAPRVISPLRERPVGADRSQDDKDPRCVILRK